MGKWPYYRRHRATDSDCEGKISRNHHEPNASGASKHAYTRPLLLATLSRHSPCQTKRLLQPFPYSPPSHCSSFGIEPCPQSLPKACLYPNLLIPLFHPPSPDPRSPRAPPSSYLNISSLVAFQFHSCSSPFLSPTEFPLLHSLPLLPTTPPHHSPLHHSPPHHSPPLSAHHPLTARQTLPPLSTTISLSRDRRRKRATPVVVVCTTA